jgi:TolB protein
MSANGSAVTQLTKNLRDDVGPSWSLDGSKIAFASNASRTNVEVYVMNANGSDVTRLTNSPDFDGEPAWRP